MNNQEHCMMKCTYCDLEDFYYDGHRLCFVYNCRKYKKPIQQAADFCDFAKSRDQTGDRVRHPDHYTWKGVECIKIIEVMTRGMSGIEAYYMGNAVKYLYRFLRKNGGEDLDKAIQYITMLREYRYGKKQEVESPDGAGEIPKED